MSQNKTSLTFHSIFVVPCSLLIFLHVSACGSKPPVETAPVVRPVKTILVRGAEDSSQRSFTGKAEASEKAAIAFRVAGKVETVNVKMGDRVVRDQVLATLDPRDFKFNCDALENNLKEAKANLQTLQTGARAEDIASLKAALQAAEARVVEASKTYARMKRLLAEGMVTQANYDSALAAWEQATAARETAAQNLAKGRAGGRKEEIDAANALVLSLQAKLETARAALDDTILRAPFDGVISERRIEPFEQVTPQTLVFSIENHSLIEIHVGIPEDYIFMRNRIAGVTIQARFEPLKDKLFPARLKEIGVNANTDSHTYKTTVIVDNPNDEILPGMTAEVIFHIALKETPIAGMMWIPLTAIFEDNGTTWVWIVDPQTHRVHMKSVEIGSPESQFIPVKGDIQAGDILVTAGVHYLQEGQEVRVISEEGQSGVQL